MKYAFLLITIILIQVKLNGQGATANGVTGNMPGGAPIPIGDLGSEKFRTYSLDYNDINGNPYLEKEMLRGHVVLINKNMTNELSIQYDIYRNEFFYLNEDEKELVIDQKFIREIVMEGKEESYLFKRVNPKSPLKLYEILYESESLNIFNDATINLTEGRYNGIAKIEPKFSRVDKYYVMQKGENPKRIKFKKKEFYKLFSNETQKAMDKITQQRKLNLKNSKDLKKLLLAIKS